MPPNSYSLDIGGKPVTLHHTALERNSPYAHLPNPDAAEYAAAIMADVARQRAEAEARNRLDELDAEFDRSDDGPGTLIRFTRAGWVDPTVDLWFAVVRGGDGRWWATGKHGPEGVTTEELIAWLVGLEVGAVDLEWFPPAMTDDDE